MVMAKVDKRLANLEDVYMEQVTLAKSNNLVK